CAKGGYGRGFDYW
nr:immunoglobulin heavy chain junction region [Mus musculus]